MQVLFKNITFVLIPLLFIFKIDKTPLDGNVWLYTQSFAAYKMIHTFSCVFKTCRKIIARSLIEKKSKKKIKRNYPAFICSKLSIETPQKCVKYVQNQQKRHKTSLLRSFWCLYWQLWTNFLHCLVFILLYFKVYLLAG